MQTIQLENIKRHFLCQWVSLTLVIMIAVMPVMNSGSSAWAQETVSVTLPPEQSVFGLEKKEPKPDPEAIDYIVKNEIVSENKEYFNHVDRNTRSISISGKTLVFEEGHPNRLYESYNNNEDIRALTLYAETLIIRSPLSLPQTNVTILARNLKFEGSGVLNTTPRSISTRPAQFQNGVHGLNAGNVTLHIESFYSEPGLDVRFVLNGGNGQPAGLGKNGANGTSLTTKTDCGYNNVVYEKHDRENRCCALICFPCGWVTTTFGDPNIWPGDGQKGTSGGKPGNGGNAGNIYSTINMFAKNFNQNGGYGGEKALDSIGGKPGNPVSSVKIDRCTRWSGEVTKCDVTDTHTSKAGENIVSPSADIFIGQNGTSSSIGNSLSWLHPFALKSILNHAKDLYLNGYLNETKDILSQYVQFIQSYKNMAEWASLTATDQAEFVQLKGEMEIILHRIASNLDYFGNPAGWVPMLSFEVTKAMYETEIERAIRVLYLTYWLGHAAADLQSKINSFGMAQDQLELELIGFQNRYTQVVEELIPMLQSESDELTNKIIYTQSEIQNKLQELQSQAEANMRPDFWKQVAGTLSTICTLLPIGQPILGAIGQGLSLISNFDPVNPLPTITGAIGLAGTFNQANFETVANSWNQVCKQIDFNTVYENNGVITYATNLNNLASPMVDSINKISATLERTTAPRNEIEAELERLKAASPEYQELIKKIKQLLLKKEAFANRLALTLQQTMNLSNGVVHNLLAMDGLNHQITEGNAAIDQRAVIYLKDMERRAKERLLKYHYYLAKAYEYRVVEPYPWELDLNRIFEKFKIIAETSVDGILSQTDFQALKALYDEQLSSITDEILDEYLSNPPELSAPVRFSLPPDKIAQLNSGESVVINPKEMGLFRAGEENIRIVKFKVTQIDASMAYSDCWFAYFDLYLEHSGTSKIRKDGENYLFRHYNNSTSNPLSWITRYDGFDGIFDSIEPSAASESLLKSLIGNNGLIDDLLLFSRPGADANIVIRKEMNPWSCSDIPIKSIRFEIVYDFTRAPTWLKTLDISVTDGFMPYFKLDKSDLNVRQNGIGMFQRAFYKGDAFTITAPATYGNYKFDKWTDRMGTLIGSNRALSMTMSDSRSLKANYVLSIQDSDNDGLSDELEAETCMDPFDADTDDDGIPDGVEDINHNGIGDGGETDACNWDTDGDGISDGTELGYILSDIGVDTDINRFVADANPVTRTDPLLADTDGDGISDGMEDRNHNGARDVGEMDPESMDAVVALPLNSLNTVQYGYNWGTDEHRDVLAATFQNNKKDRLIHVRSFDMDSSDEVSVYINGKFLGYLSGDAETFGPDMIWWIPISMQITGENRIEFHQNFSNEEWGIDRLGIYNPGSAFGNIKNLAGGDTQHPNGIEIHFQASTAKILEVFGWDSDSDQEIGFKLNGKAIGELPQGKNNRWTAIYQLYLPKSLLTSGDNILGISNRLNTGYNWGIKLRYLRDGATGLGQGLSAPAFLTQVMYLIPSGETGCRISLRYYDATYIDEIKVFVNGMATAFAPVTGVKQWSGSRYLTLNPKQMAVIQVNNTYNPLNTYIWGVKINGYNELF